MRKWFFSAAGAMMVAGAMARSAAAAAIFADDFSEPNDTLVNGKPSDIGGAWVETTSTNLTVQNSAVDTTNAARKLFVGFTRPLAAGEVLTMTFNSSDTSPFRAGGAYAGVSLFSEYVDGGNNGAERIFVGDLSSNGDGWASEASNNSGSITSANQSLPATVQFTYAYDTGAATLSVNGSQLGSANYTAGYALNGIRIANDSGGDIRVNDITVEVPEPATAALIGLAATTAIFARRRRRA